jgi:hypothetical protein
MSSNIQVRAGHRRIPQRHEAPAISGQQRYRAKLWAKAHGYSGDLGGWIYDLSGQHVAHGWAWFYWDRSQAIERWYKDHKAKRPMINMANGSDLVFMKDD